MFYPLAVALLAITRLRLASAAVYPTRPTSTTICVAGSDERVEWKDSYARPKLIETGKMSISLCATAGENCVLLAENVSPISRAHTVHIPAHTPLGLYVMIFKTRYPAMEYWTADFPIVAAPKPAVDESNLNSTSDAPARHYLTLVLPTETIVSDFLAASKVPAATTITAGPPPKDGGGGVGLKRLGSPNTASPRSNTFWDGRLRGLEILWPALVGVSLAF
ncbi:hypothetical protein MKEN_00510300 [Mycena kentingensis (nom. inval.)]|nr:hypothetical protein MKEN_00510300 [Mycena kentingensis (nom. inval.)]